jgi:CHRD domain-containing protein
MADRGKERPTMQPSKNARTVGRVGVFLASVSSVLVLAGPTSASAHEVSSAYQAGNGHFSITLTSGEVPSGGDPDGQGSATLDLKPQEKTACFTINWSRLSGEVTALHLHVAARGSEGPHAIDFFNNQHFPGAQYTASGCVPTTPETINAVINRPADYYFNVHSTAFPGGALRGQLN